MGRFTDIDPREPLTALGVEGVADVRPITGGMDTLIWRVDTYSGPYALRIFRADQLRQWSGEIGAMQLVSSLGVPVPRIAAHGMWGDRPAMLLEWCEGRTVLDEVLAHPEMLEPIGKSMGRLQARMHAITVPSEYWVDHRDWLGLAGWEQDALIARLRAQGLHDGHLLHLDFHPLNVLCVGGEASVVLDWSNVAVGDPRADVARTLSIFRLVSPPPTSPLSGFTAARSALESAWLEGYTQVAGPLPDMTLFEIWAEMAFIHDMEKKLGMPDFWMQPKDFDRLRAHVAGLKRAAGIR